MRILARGILRLAVLLTLLLLAVCILLQDAMCPGCEVDEAERAKTTPNPRIGQVTKSLAEISRLPGLSDHIMFFNRIPKSGSELFVLILQRLQGSRFRHVRLGGNRLKRMNKDQQKIFTAEISEIIQEQAIPLSFDRIVYFTNFTEFGIQSPIYFNLIRDPLENAMSRMASLSLNRANNSEGSKKSSAENFAECWLAGDPECSLIDEVPYDFTIPYFCGHEIDCMKLNNQNALNKAKENVDRYYPVVGLLEYPNETLFMLENKLPLFFKGASDLYINKQRRWTTQSELKNISNDQLRSILYTEYDFYNWAKVRLLRQASLIVPAKHKSTMYSQKYNYLTER